MPETVSLSLQYANVILLQGEGQHVEDSDQIPGENGMIYITGDTHGAVSYTHLTLPMKLEV